MTSIFEGKPPKTRAPFRPLNKGQLDSRYIWGFPKMVVPWYPTTMGFPSFPTKNDPFEV